jgi:hypothetical protein
MKTLKPCMMAIMASMLITAQTNAQNWQTIGNPINPGEFLGGTNGLALDIRQNNILRAQFNNGTFAGYNGQAPINNVNRIFLPITGAVQQPFSMLQIGFPIPDLNLQRPWMNVGITYGAGVSADILHVGLLQRPAGTTNSSIVDAVVAWGCNDQLLIPSNGPDNLRFLFLAPSNQPITPGSQAEGMETMRITPWGNVGIGDFSFMPTGIGATYGQPRARLDVQFLNNLPANTENTAAIFHNDVFANVGQSIIQYKRGIHGIC